jgi:hypothetical protein
MSRTYSLLVIKLLISTSQSLIQVSLIIHIVYFQIQKKIWRNSHKLLTHFMKIYTATFGFCVFENCFFVEVSRIRSFHFPDLQGRQHNRCVTPYSIRHFNDRVQVRPDLQSNSLQGSSRFRVKRAAKL